MKKSILSLFSFVFAVSLFTSCNKNDAGITQPQDNNTPTNSSATVVSGSFVLSSFVQKAEDKTRQFDGYIFTFNTTGTNAGTVTAVKGSSSVNGTWTYSPAVTYYGSTSKTSITISMGASTPFILLNKTWNVDSTSTSTKMALSSPELAENEHVEFTKQ
jgi:hypothetical protein